MVWWRKARKYGCSVMLPPRGGCCSRGNLLSGLQSKGAGKTRQQSKLGPSGEILPSSKNLSKSYYLTSSENEKGNSLAPPPALRAHGHSAHTVEEQSLFDPPVRPVGGRRSNETPNSVVQGINRALEKNN